VEFRNVGFYRGRKTGEPIENPSKQRQEPTVNSALILFTSIILSITHSQTFIIYHSGEQRWRSGESACLRFSQFPVPVSCVGWVCCWFSSLLQEVFLRVLRFSPLLKNQHFQIPIRSGVHEHILKSFQAPKCFVGKQITNYKISITFLFRSSFLPFVLGIFCTVPAMFKLLLQFWCSETEISHQYRYCHSPNIGTQCAQNQWPPTHPHQNNLVVIHYKTW